MIGIAKKTIVNINNQTKASMLASSTAADKYVHDTIILRKNTQQVHSRLPAQK
jgi:hypothetical protein